MIRRVVAVVLFAVATVILVVTVPSARRERDAARAQHRAARTEREQLRVRLADLQRRTSEDAPTAVDGADAVRALRTAVLAATEGLEVDGVEIAATPSARGPVAAQGRLAAEGRFVEALRLARRLASSSSGLLLEQVTLREARAGVRLEAEAFILKEAP